VSAPLKSGKGDILVFDVGATSIKYCQVTLAGERIDSVRRRPTPRPLSPEGLIDFVQKRVNQFDVEKIALGFPGECFDGVVIDSGNLSRGADISSATDELISEQWRGFPIEEALGERIRREVRVVNDALLAALGCVSRTGRELMITLGTGFGVALVDNGVPESVRDFGAESFEGEKTFDTALGEQARSRDEAEWLRNVGRAVTQIALEFKVDHVFVGGGNGLRLPPELFKSFSIPVSKSRNESALLGAAQLFTTG